MTSCLFDALTPPQLDARPNTHRGATYDALKIHCLRRWQWKREVERTADNLLHARDSSRNPEQESAGRNIRHVRESLRAHGWTVLDERGRVCLCRDDEVDSMLEVLGE